MDWVADRFLLCLNTFTSQIICLWLTTIWNNTFTSEIWCLWLTHDPASRWLMASSVTTRRRIALLYFGFTLQSSCCVQAPKAVAGGTCSALVHYLYSSACPVSAVEHQVEPADKQQKQQRRLALLTVHRLLLWLPEILETEDPMWLTAAWNKPQQSVKRWNSYKKF